ncbi:ribosome biogenesis GTP-binding protein YihA/YsxC [Bacillus tianshenii]|nr:ribosome biogenesis GTP-binding protein YihA/YsxC [Bacillus tianshenii]
MKVTKSEFIKSAVYPEHYPEEDYPEVALAGRSNVGKSSLINKLTNRKNLARISSKPGKTQTLNYFLINEMLYFVDVPGYGFAKVSKKERETWGKMMEIYFTSSERLRVVVQIVDLRHPPSNDDIVMYDFLKHYEIPVIVAATKADKVKKSQIQKHLKIVKQTLEMEPDDDLILFSSQTGQGKDEVWKAIQSRL